MNFHGDLIDTLQHRAEAGEHSKLVALAVNLEKVYAAPSVCLQKSRETSHEAWCSYSSCCATFFAE
eukprot:CAMPEP_0119348790 /NCGR_PEP_ID=MMETSP1333-20130426/109224_1 /TAXON_ID=418940 /ORGANISM="Scyphosphaera apsteinii, Strain RCC1455" /LENGTH=65 /DNA_ID=CAMNT_0007361381 /DNA_START=33 /DNA_END=230 /DNA_ORIENTATION=-